MNNISKLPALGNGFLKPGDHVIHFYYSKAEQLRFAVFLQEGFDRGDGIIVAAVGERHPLLTQAIREPRLQRRRNLLRLQVTPNLNATISSIRQAGLTLLQRTRELRIVADFDGLISPERLFENEAELTDALGGRRILLVSQYDGNVFPAAITMEQFHTHAVTLVGNAFYSENRNCMSPAEYLRTRHRKAHAAVAGSVAVRAAGA